ncbi:MAG TPA: YggT family protein, partial [Armatimonadetes bacterium]|nr:YggT family protein [Armatimonadota bacterium]
CIISWMPSAKVQYHPVSIFIMRVTDPILEPFRKLIPTYRYGVDISPAIAIIVIWLLARLLASAFIP